MDRVYVVMGFSSESQCPPDTTDVIGVFSTPEAAKACIDRASEHLKKWGRRVETTDTSISGSIGDWYYEYYYEEFELDKEKT